ncbi:unnamed protein product [Dicrocoelium dendriticum]|nr:unnamed protein product [Dicrocoelium dendriticum]
MMGFHLLRNLKLQVKNAAKSQLSSEYKLLCFQLIHPMQSKQKPNANITDYVQSDVELGHVARTQAATAPHVTEHDIGANSNKYARHSRNESESERKLEFELVLKVDQLREARRSKRGATSFLNTKLSESTHEVMVRKKLKARCGALFAISMLLLLIWRLDQHNKEHLAGKLRLSDLNMLPSRKSIDALSFACQSNLVQLRRGLLSLGAHLEHSQWNTNVQLVSNAAHLTKQATIVCEEYRRSVNRVATPSFWEEQGQRQLDAIVEDKLQNAQTLEKLHQIELQYQPSISQGLRYCLTTLDDEVNQVTNQNIYSRLLDHPGYIGTCSENHFHDRLLVTLGWPSEGQCGFERVQGGTADFKCLVILPTFDSVVRFNQDVKAFQYGLENTVVAAGVFYPSRYRRHTDVLLAAMTLHEVYEQPTATSIQITRPISLIASFGRISQVAVMTTTEMFIIDKLRNIANRSMARKVRMVFHDPQHFPVRCWNNEALMDLVQSTPISSPWFPCSDTPMLLQKSTFGLVLGSSLFSEIKDVQPGDLSFQMQLLLCLKSGSIPVVIGEAAFPFPKAIGEAQWHHAVLLLSTEQIDQMLPFLGAISVARIEEMRNHGQLILHRHFTDLHAHLSTLMLEIANRYGLAQQPAPEYYTKLVQMPSPHVTYHTLASIMHQGYPAPTGPAKFPVDGITETMVQRALIRPSDVWKVDPFHTYPTTPWHVIEKLKGAPERKTDKPKNSSSAEQFTAVILYYERLESLMKMLFEFSNLTTLQSVVIVWNNPIAPDTTIDWPNTSYAIRVLYGLKNSLNNRFLPLDLIQTDAVLSLDDDSRMTTDELNFGFRVWRENREQIVGYPARSHEKSQDGAKWKYITEQNCKYSMVLTGATFFHKYFMFSYTWLMPDEVRQMVDRRMNCEDLAMNFLVSHTVRRPPLKVTSRNTFVCGDCPRKGLNLRKKHYEERSVCIDELVKIYGYNPLIHTSYRAERLEKIPADCQ